MGVRGRYRFGKIERYLGIYSLEEIYSLGESKSGNIEGKLRKI